MKLFLYVILHNVLTNFTSILVTRILYLQPFVIMKVAIGVIHVGMRVKDVLKAVGVHCKGY